MRLALEQVESRDVMAAGALASLGQGLAIAPMQGVRTESVGKDETLAIRSAQTQATTFHLLPYVEQDNLWKSSSGRITSIAVDPSDPSGNTSQQGIIAILIGL